MTTDTASATTTDDPAPVLTRETAPDFRPESVTVDAPVTKGESGRTLVFTVRGLPGVQRDLTVEGIDEVMAKLRQILAQAGLSPGGVPHLTIIHKYETEMRILVDAAGNDAGTLVAVLTALMRVWTVSGLDEFFWAKPNPTSANSDPA
jgi:hypothetical protein